MSPVETGRIPVSVSCPSTAQLNCPRTLPTAGRPSHPTPGLLPRQPLRSSARDWPALASRTPWASCPTGPAHLFLPSCWEASRQGEPTAGAGACCVCEHLTHPMAPAQLPSSSVRGPFHSSNFRCIIFSLGSRATVLRTQTGSMTSAQTAQTPPSRQEVVSKANELQNMPGHRAPQEPLGRCPAAQVAARQPWIQGKEKTATPQRPSLGEPSRRENRILANVKL